ncbi:MAG: thioredoxin domain-containing protein [Ardenticatenales bacterium]
MVCQAMRPVVHGLEDRYKDKIGFVYMDIDDRATETLQQQLAFRGQPYYVLVDGAGAKVAEWQGSTPEREFVAAFDRALAE